MTESVSDQAARRVDQQPIQAFAHDVNNPLTVALIRVALAKRRLQGDDIDRDALRRGLGDAETQIRRAAALVADLERANRHDAADWPPAVAGGSHEAGDGQSAAAGAGAGSATVAERGRWLPMCSLLDAAHARCDRARALLDGLPTARVVHDAGTGR